MMSGTIANDQQPVLTCVWIGGVEVPDEQDEEDDDERYRDDSETPHNDSMTFGRADHRVEHCPN
jgi:hypothetical protein